ncbi:MAG TPA: alpha/beta fold hydrolase [Bryobacteraceae bacterium]|nr:alpha/beta fold hydrolase [Bryobacteraceae bacterium]
MSGNPVILLHGLGDTVAIFEHMQAYLERGGLRAHAFNLVPNNGRAPLPELARQLDDYIRAAFGEDETVDLVGFSMGGLVSRYYLQRLGGMERVRRLVTIGTPHHGTWSAYVLGSPGVRNMRPGSAFLRDINQDMETLEGVLLASIWTPFDLMIVPATSSRVRVGRSISVRTLVHPLLVRDPRVMRLVLDILGK